MKKALITILLIVAAGSAARAGEGSLDTLRDLPAKLTAESVAAPAVPAPVAALETETPKLFKAEMSWYPVKVNALAQLGARKTAEEAAGYLACFVVKSVVLSCDSFRCEAQAFAKAFQAR